MNTFPLNTTWTTGAGLKGPVSFSCLSDKGGFEFYTLDGCAPGQPAIECDETQDIVESTTVEILFVDGKIGIPTPQIWGDGFIDFGESIADCIRTLGYVSQDVCMVLAKNIHYLESGEHVEYLVVTQNELVSAKELLNVCKCGEITVRQDGVCHHDFVWPYGQIERLNEAPSMVDLYNQAIEEAQLEEAWEERQAYYAHLEAEAEGFRKEFLAEEAFTVGCIYTAFGMPDYQYRVWIEEHFADGQGEGLI